MPPTTRLLPTLAALALAGSATAQSASNVVPAAKFAWSENAGWINFRDGGSPAGAQGVRVNPTFLSGFAWGENIGWINFGDGSPGTFTGYGNTDGSDTGVNIAASNLLSGLAWGENVGWINFGPFASIPTAQQARFDFVARRFRGYAWGENIGWINLDDGVSFVSACLADYTGDGVRSPADIFAFLNAYFAGNRTTDFNRDGVRNPADIFAFLNTYFAGC
jgi:hypothetical protein